MYVVLADPRAYTTHLKHATRIMTNAEKVYDDFLYDCYIANRRLTPEEWAYYGKEEHHIEIPNRDGGLLTPCNSQYLTTYQHWIAGILQSEVLQKCCFAYVPRNVLQGTVEQLRSKWQNVSSLEAAAKGCKKGGEATYRMELGIHAPEWHKQEWVQEYKRQTGLRAVAEQTGVHAPGYRHTPEFIERSRQTGKLLVEQKKGIHALTPEQKSANMTEWWSQLSDDEKSARGKQAWDNKSAEERSEVAQRSAETVRATYTPEQLLERARKIARARAPRPIILTTPDGEEIYYELQYDACIEHGLESPKVGAICRGKRKTHKGFTARYAD